ANQPAASERPCATPDRAQPRRARRTPPAGPLKASANALRRLDRAARPDLRHYSGAPSPAASAGPSRKFGPRSHGPRLRECAPAPKSDAPPPRPSQPRPHCEAPPPSNPIAQSPPPCPSIRLLTRERLSIQRFADSGIPLASQFKRPLVLFRAGGARPPVQAMIAFIDDHRQAYGVEPICRVLPIAPSTYHAHLARRADPSRLPDRVRRDADLKVEIRRVFEENFRVYGVRKVWRQLRREGFSVARCTVARLMRNTGLRGAIRGKPVRTTISDKAAPCPLDHVNRQFHASAPDRLW